MRAGARNPRGRSLGAMVQEHLRKRQGVRLVGTRWGCCLGGRARNPGGTGSRICAMRGGDTLIERLVRRAGGRAGASGGGSTTHKRLSLPTNQPPTQPASQPAANLTNQGERPHTHNPHAQPTGTPRGPTIKHPVGAALPREGRAVGAPHAGGDGWAGQLEERHLQPDCEHHQAHALACRKETGEEKNT